MTKKTKTLLFSLVVFGIAFIAFFSLYSLFSASENKKARENATGFYRPGTLPGLVHEHVPGKSGFLNGVRVRINSLGWRGPEPASPKPPGVVRVVVFGDSIVFGQGVEEQDTLSAQLLSELKKRRPEIQWETLNAGVRGYNMKDYLAVFKPRVMSLDPDFLVFVITEINDPELHYFKPESEKLERLQNAWWAKLPFIKPFLALPLAEEINRIFVDHVQKIYDPKSEDWAFLVKGLETIARECREAEVPLVAVTFPYLADENLFAKQRKQLQDTLTALGIMWIDPRPELARFPAKELVVSPSDFHPNRKALSIVAEKIAETLSELVSPEVP